MTYSLHYCLTSSCHNRLPHYKHKALAPIAVVMETEDKELKRMQTAKKRVNRRSTSIKPSSKASRALFKQELVDAAFTAAAIATLFASEIAEAEAQSANRQANSQLQ